MKLYQNKYLIILMSIVSFLLLFYIFKMIKFLSLEKYIVECFENNIIKEKSDSSTSHTVDLPLTTKYSCQNFCGPTARCAITGQQCFTDIDCPGCQPKQYNKTDSNIDIPGDNGAGKLTFGVTPQYSPLTSGYGTHENILNNSKPVQANFGVDTWSSSFNEGKQLFDKRYKPPDMQFMPQYKPEYSLTGAFVNDEPLPSNY